MDTIQEPQCIIWFWYRLWCRQQLKRQMSRSFLQDWNVQRSSVCLSDRVSRGGHWRERRTTRQCSTFQLLEESRIWEEVCSWSEPDRSCVFPLILSTAGGFVGGWTGRWSADRQVWIRPGQERSMRSIQENKLFFEQRDQGGDHKPQLDLSGRRLTVFRVEKQRASARMSQA